MCGKPVGRLADAGDAHGTRGVRRKIRSVRCRGGAADERGGGVGRLQAVRRAGVEGCALALSVVGRNSASGYPVSLRGLVPAACTVPTVISPVLLRLGGLLHAVALDADGASQEENHAMTAPRPRSRQPQQLDAGIFQAEINSFALRLADEGKAAKTIRT